jgi:hypothetical protein
VIGAPQFTASFRNPGYRYQRWVWIGLASVCVPLSVLSFVFRHWVMGAIGVSFIVEGLFFGYRYPKVEVRLEPAALTIRNIRRAHLLPWTQVTGFDLLGRIDQRVVALRQNGRPIGIDALSVQFQKEASPRLTAAMQELEAARAYFTATTPPG